MTVESCSSSFDYHKIICISSRISADKELWLSKFAELHVFRMGENSELFMFLRLSIKVRVPNPKSATFEDVYFPPVASEVGEGRSLNTNELHNFEKFLETNQQLIFFIRK